MIDAKQATKLAMQAAADMLGQANSDLEELERERYNDHEVWSITLSFPRNAPSALVRLAGPLQYKRFLIDVETGELVAMKLR
jgi:hypothetical protein